MISVADVMRDTSLPAGIRNLLYLIPAARRHELEFCGIYRCMRSGVETVILKREHRFIVCTSGIDMNCVESPDIFLAMEGIGICQHLWKE
jgi:hypothetical protein